MVAGENSVGDDNRHKDRRLRISTKRCVGDYVLKNSKFEMTCNIDPLVMLQVSDHITRSKHRGIQGIVGILLGSESIISAALQVQITPCGIDIELAKTSVSLHAEIHPHHEVIGLYLSAGSPDSLLTALASSLSLTEFYVLNISQNLQFQLHSCRSSFSQIKLVQPLSHSYRGCESTLIALRDVSNTPDPSVTLAKKTSDGINSISLAFETLLNKFEILSNYTERVRNGEIQPDAQTLQEIQDVINEFNCGLIPDKSGEEVEEAARAVVRLAVATKLKQVQ